MSIEGLSNNKQAVNNLSSNRIQNAYQKDSVNAEAVKTQQNSAQNIKNTTQTPVNTDSVVITDAAKKLNTAQEKAKSSSGINSAKVDSIKQSISNGDYKINYDRVADKIISQEKSLSSILD